MRITYPVFTNAAAAPSFLVLRNRTVAIPVPPPVSSGGSDFNTGLN